MCVWGGGVLRQWGVVSEDFRHQRRAPRVLRQSEGASRGFKKLGVAFRDLRQWGGVCRDFRQQEDLQKLWQWEGAAHLSKHVPLTCTPQSCPEAKRNRWRLNEDVGRNPEPLRGREGPTSTPTPLPPLCRNKAHQLRKRGGSGKPEVRPSPTLSYLPVPQVLTQSPPRTGH